MHSPVEGFNADSLYNALELIQPDVILYEVDSSFFDTDFKFKKELKSVEHEVTIKYLNENKEAIVRPYDFTGRNSYRINVGSRPVDNYTLKILDSLYKNDLLNENHKNIYEDYQELNGKLNEIALRGIQSFNDDVTDRVVEKRQHHQYTKLTTVVDALPVFDSLTHAKPDGSKITYKEGYSLAGDFWHKRNNAMANHILKFSKEFSGKKIVVLNGFFHRYYLTKLLSDKQEAYNFNLQELHTYYK